MIIRIFHILLFSVLSFSLFGQRMDKIRQVQARLKTAQHDTARAADLILLSKLFFKVDHKQALKYYEEGNALAAKLGRTDLRISAFNALADGYWYAAQYDNAFNYYYKAYQLADSVNNKEEICLSLYNLGWLSCIDQKNYKDMNYLYRSLQLAIELKDEFGVIRAHNALGDAYSLKFQDLRDKKDFDSSVFYLKNGLDLSRKTKRYTHMNTFYVNLGDLFYSVKDYKTARFYCANALDSYRLKGDSADLIYVVYKIALCDYALGKRKDALKIFKNAYEYFQGTGNRDSELEVLGSLSKLYYDLGSYKEAYEYYDKYAKLKSDIDRRSYTTSLKGMENSRDLEKANTSVIQLKQSNEIQELKNKRKTIFISVLILIGLVIVVIAYLLFRQNKLRQVTNLKLKEQNKIISDKKLEIEQSIEYAKGIQTAFLPAKEGLGLLIKESFILYRPKDVISGDFYWYLSCEDQNGILIACADCTGHGVPGALMSMVGINVLQQLSVERKMRSPALILKYLNAEIKNSLKQNTDQSVQRDGMDIALIYFDISSQKLIYAGANRPLYIIRNKEVIEYKATKHAIGGFTKYDQTFEEIKIDLQKGDLICLSTDGYADQFGRDGKKFMTKKLKTLLAQISHLSAADQKAQLESVFNNWKGLQEQVDDVCLIGLKV
jgi:serine phosphatase RsbU (regulator of sigma subunit)